MADQFARVVSLAGVVALGAWAQPVEAPAPSPSPTVAPAPAAEARKPVEFNAGFGTGLVVKADAFTFTLHGLLQPQGLFIVPEAGTTQASRQNELMVRRARLSFRGDGPHKLSFSIQGGFTGLDLESDMPVPLLDAWVQWAGLRDLSIRVGQMRVPFNGQRNVTAFNLQFVDRSLASLEYTLDRDVGLLLYSDDFLGLGDRVRYFVGVFGGDGRNRVVANAGLLYTARVRISPFGKFDDREEGDPGRDSKFRLSLGAGVARNNDTNRPRSTMGTPYKLAGGFDYTHATGEVAAKWRGASLQGEVYWRHADQATREGTLSGQPVVEYARSGWGWFVQGGYFLTPWMEVAARYGDVRPETDPAAKFQRVREAGGALNFFFQRHDLKVQADYLYLDDGTGHESRHQVRLQGTVYF